MAILLFRPDKQNPPRNAKVILDRYTLNPGRNHFKDKDFEGIKAHFYFEDWVRRGIIEIVTEKPIPEDKQRTPIATLTVAEAIKVVESENNLSVLQEWAAFESNNKNRATVLNAINRQIQDVKGGNL